MFGGRSVDSWVQLDRADVGYVESILAIGHKLREYRAHHGYLEDDPFDPATTVDKPLVDKLEDATYWTRGVGPRPELGKAGERLGAIFRPKLVPTEEQRIVELTEQKMREEEDRAKEIKPPRER